jgi:hypothetical protein
MKGTRPLVIHFSLLLAAAILAYWVFSRPDDEAPNQETPILDIPFSDIERITFSTDAKIVELVPGKAERVTVSVYERDEEVPDPEKWDEEEEEETDQDEPVPEERSASADALHDDTDRSVYRASSELMERLKKRFPLLARRRLGAPEGAALAKFGLTRPQGTLTVEAKGRTAVFEVGAGSFGGQTTYFRQRPEGTLFLVDADLLRSVHGAQAPWHRQGRGHGDHGAGRRQDPQDRPNRQGQESRVGAGELSGYAERHDGQLDRCALQDERQSVPA